MCLMNLSNVNGIQQISIPNIDKIVHFTLYAVLAFIWMYSLYQNGKENSFRNNAILVFTIFSLFGVLIEFLQENFTQTRSAEILDVLSNCTGLLFGIIISKLILK